MSDCPRRAAKAVRDYASLRKKAREQDRRAVAAARRAVRILRQRPAEDEWTGRGTVARAVTSASAPTRPGRSLSMVSLALHGIGRASLVALVLIMVAASLAAQGGRGAGPVSDGRSEDCLPYDVGSLVLRPQPDNAWLLTDGHDRMVVFDNRKDADNALALAQRYQMHCFIGRHASTRSNAPGRPSPEYHASSTGRCLPARQPPFRRSPAHSMCRQG